MRREIGYLSEIHAAGGWIGLTTSGTAGRDGHVFFEAGIGLIVGQRFPELKIKLGRAILSGGNHAHAWPEYQIVTIPFKPEQSHACIPALIEESAHEVSKLLDEHRITKLYVPESCYGGIGDACVERCLTVVWDDRVIYLVNQGKRDNAIPGNCPFEKND